MVVFLLERLDGDGGTCLLGREDTGEVHGESNFSSFSSICLCLMGLLGRLLGAEAACRVRCLGVGTLDDDDDDDSFALTMVVAEGERRGAEDGALARLPRIRGLGRIFDFLGFSFFFEKGLDKSAISVESSLSGRGLGTVRAIRFLCLGGGRLRDFGGAVRLPGDARGGSCDSSGEARGDLGG